MGSVGDTAIRERVIEELIGEAEEGRYELLNYIVENAPTPQGINFLNDLENLSVIIAKSYHNVNPDFGYEGRFGTSVPNGRNMLLS